MLSKILSCVLQNALKFTETGSVKLIMQLSQGRQHILINIKDTGVGIPEHFKAKIFRPFTQEDVSITRPSEGLGLGLLVARGLARKLGGDLVLIGSNTSGPNKGSVSASIVLSLWVLNFAGISNEYTSFPFRFRRAHCFANCFGPPPFAP